MSVTLNSISGSTEQGACASTTLSELDAKLQIADEQFFQSLRAKAHKSSQTIKRLHQEVGTLKEELNTMHQQVAGEHYDIDLQKKDLSDMHHKYFSIFLAQSQVNALMQEMETMRQKYDSLAQEQGRFDVLKKELKDAQQEQGVDELRHDLKNLHKKYESMLQEQRQVDVLITELKKVHEGNPVAQVQIDVGALREDMKDIVKDEVSDLHQKYRSLAQEKGDFEMVRKKLEDLDLKYDSLVQEHVLLKKNLADYQASCSPGCNATVAVQDEESNLREVRTDLKFAGCDDSAEARTPTTASITTTNDSSEISPSLPDPSKHRCPSGIPTMQPASYMKWPVLTTTSIILTDQRTGQARSYSNVANQALPKYPLENMASRNVTRVVRSSSTLLEPKLKTQDIVHRRWVDKHPLENTAPENVTSLVRSSSAFFESKLKTQVLEPKTPTKVIRLVSRA